MSGLPDIEESYATEVVRKGIHLCSLSIPIGYAFLDKSAVLSVLVPLTAAFVLADAARLFFPPVTMIYHQWFGSLLRSGERDQKSKRLTGASYVLLSACMCVWLFPKVVAITAFAILIISDTVAALIGRKFGRQPFLGKTAEGAIGFFVSACVVVLLSPKVDHEPAEYAVGAAGALIGTIVESLSLSVDDNLTIPLSVGATMWILYALFLPAVNVLAMG